MSERTPAFLSLVRPVIPGVRQATRAWQAIQGLLTARLPWAFTGILWVALSMPAARGETVELSISCGAVGIELELCRQGVQAWSERTGHRVRVVSTPNSASERLALYQQMLAARAPDIDIFQIDVVWPGILAGHFIDLAEAAGDAPAAHFPTLIENNMVDGRLVAMPWYTDAGVLFYRADLLERHGREVPASWQELTDTARHIQAAERAQGNDRLWGFVWQGRAYEGLTCNVVEWFDAFGAGAVVDEDGRITVDNPRAREALTLAASWVGDISPPGILNYDEEAARGVFQSGFAVFMRNWPYAWALAQGADSPVRGRVGVTALPPGGPQGKPTGTLGGWQLAVSRYSRHPREAADLVMFLTSLDEQKRRAIAGAYNPTLPALYEDADVLAAVPFFGELLDTFTHAVARPSRVTGTRYNRVSAALWNAAHDTLAGKTDAANSLQSLERALYRVRRAGW